jgi:tyrosyl-tRNA synthetase
MSNENQTAKDGISAGFGGNCHEPSIKKDERKVLTDKEVDEAWDEIYEQASKIAKANFKAD